MNPRDQVVSRFEGSLVHNSTAATKLISHFSSLYGGRFYLFMQEFDIASGI